MSSGTSKLRGRSSGILGRPVNPRITSEGGGDQRRRLTNCSRGSSMSGPAIGVVGLLVVLTLGFPNQARAEGGFYAVSKAEVAGPPGSLIRIEPWPIESVYKAKVFRILYRSTGLNGEP